MNTQVIGEKGQLFLLENIKKRYNLQQTLRLGREKIIDIALQLIKQDRTIRPAMTIADFDFVRVMTNQRKIIVSFERNVRFVPMYAKFFYDIQVELPSGKVQLSGYRNNFYGNKGNFYEASGTGFSSKTQLYLESVDHRNIINKAMKVIYGEQVAINTYAWNIKMTIFEELDHYAIEEKPENPNSAYKGSFYKLRKDTGEIIGTPTIEESLTSAPRIPGISREPNRLESLGFVEVW
ncbi:hypothetical protein ACFSTE_19845 [Aquimarina hainanensis]|uniref:Uncharacterized protein n=1 Tax=Aquimarina hainanensis TaxID=1578017 RepID=A0ABW5NE25_9FLAO